MDDTNALPHYPYRDDGQMLWDTIKTYVEEYLSLYYQSATDLKDDQELQAWAKALAAPDGGKLKGITVPLVALDDLVELVTTVIFTCGPLHSAINFAQYEYMAFTPNMPLAAYAKITMKDSDRTPPPGPGALLPILPPPRRAAEQLQSIFILSAYRFDRLGYYAFEDPAAQVVVERFQQRLNVVERKIDLNNNKRLIPYIYMKPSLVINSISI
jgi:arachidonate 15-lipoxygenase